MIPNQMHRKRGGYSHIVWVAVLYASLITGCASVIGGKVKDPDILIVRNNSGVEIRSVHLMDAESTNRFRRYGSISPVPRGVSQVFPRPASAPPLPKRLLISWVTDDSFSYDKEISLATVIKSSQDPEAKAMVFDILAGKNVNVYLEVFSVGRFKY